MKKKFLSIIIAFCFALCLLPATAAAQESVTDLRVNDTEVSSVQNPTDVLGDGTVRFDADTGVLTLTNAKLTKGLSDQEYASEEHPAIRFNGQLTICLRGSNIIDTGADRVMGESLRNSAIFGDKLTITAEPGATLEIKGMVQVNSYIQTGGTVSIEMNNSHSKITKWALYVMGGPLSVSAGTFTAASTGGNRGGAVGMEDSGMFSVIDGTVLTEGDGGFDNRVSSLTFSGGLMPTSKNYVKIEAPEKAISEKIAYESMQMVELNGSAKVKLPAYALKDTNGNPTNYVRLRDLASLLNGTAAQFDILWSAETGITIAPSAAYEHPNGSEGNVPFFGDRPYTDYARPTYVGDEAKSFAAFQLADDNGGAHTYYQLRDLGRALDFNVGWSAERGIFIEPNKPYTDAD